MQREAPFDEFDRMQDELEFRHILMQIAGLPENALNLVVAQHREGVTQEMDKQKWN